MSERTETRMSSAAGAQGCSARTSWVRPALAFLALLTLLASAFCAPASALSLDLRPAAIATGAQVKLQEVVSFDLGAGEEGQAAELGAVVIGQAPLPGRTRVFSREQILARLRQAGYTPERAAVAGSASVTVQRPGRPVSREEAEELYRAELARVLGVDPGRVVVTLVNWTPPVVAEGRLRLSLLGDVAQVTRAAATGTLTGPVDLSVDGEPQATLRPRAVVTVKVPALVAREALSRGSIVGADQVELVEYELSRLPDGALRDPQQAAGRQAVRTVPAGTPLRRSDLIAPAVVRRGDRVTLTLETGLLSLAVQGLALEDGAAGEVIKVENSQSGRLVEALVRGAGDVLVVLGGSPAAGR